jgi:membrane protease YdiL (CAAX protease family)
MQDPFLHLNQVPQEKPKALWGLKEMAIGIVIVLIALFLIETVIVGPAYAVFGQDAPETLVASSIANLIWNAAMIGCVIWFVRRTGGDLRDIGLAVPEGSANPFPRIVGMAVATFVTMYLIIVFYGIVIDLLGANFLKPDQQVPDSYYSSDFALAVLGIAIVIGAPFAEEIFFRGFLFGGTRAITGAFLAAFLTGFIFSIAHYNLGLIIPFTMIGATLALSYQRSGSLFVPIGAHMLFNLVSFSILVFVPDARP